jgi:deazaflavin-dependent oxidoreductase (nitroreductase family)
MSSSFAEFNRELIKDLRAHGGKPTSGPFRGRDVLILSTRGAKSGEVRENPLVYSRDNGHYVVVGSKGGSPTNPAWYHNLVTHPKVTVEVNGEKFAANAHVVQGDEHDRLYSRHAEKNPAFLDYAKKTSRRIPVIVLERT